MSSAKILSTESISASLTPTSSFVAFTAARNWETLFGSLILYFFLILICLILFLVDELQIMHFSLKTSSFDNILAPVKKIDTYNIF